MAMRRKQTLKPQSLRVIADIGYNKVGHTFTFGHTMKRMNKFYKLVAIVTIALC